MTAAPSVGYRRAAATTLRLGWRTDRTRSTAVVMIVLLSQASAIVVAVSLRWLLDAALRHDETGVWVAATIASGVTFLSFVGYIAGYNLARLPLVEKVGVAVDEALMRVFGGSPTLEAHEMTELLDARELVRSHRRDLGEAFEDLTGWACIVGQFVVTVALLASIDVRTAVLPLFAVPSVFAARLAERHRTTASSGSAGSRRLVRHIEDLVVDERSAREVRVFGLARTLTYRHRQAWASGSQLLDRGERLATAATTAGWLVFVAGYGLSVFVIVRGAAGGSATAGDVALTLALAAQVSGQVQGVLRNGHYLLLDFRVAGAFQLLVDHRAASPTGTRSAPARLRSGIHLENLTYRYGHSSHDALHDVTISLPAGSVVALVGENGAGKTTLVKLLAGLHEPSGGRIVLDDVDLSEIDPRSWQDRIGAAFQDFARFELTALETVGVGHLPRLNDHDAVVEALAQTGSPPPEQWLAEGLPTRLGRSWGAAGTQLSGGQWQRVALARSAMRAGPLLLVLDEPTASLDPRAEHRVFENYQSIARAAAAQTGCVTLLVTHRFVAAPDADLVLVLHQGRLVEAGTHMDLLLAGGRYAGMYETQARSYRAREE